MFLKFKKKDIMKVDDWKFRRYSIIPHLYEINFSDYNGC